MTRKLRIAHIIHELGPGGAEHTLVDLAKVARSHGLELHVLSLMPLGSHTYPAQLRELDVSVTSLDLASRWDPRGLTRGLRRLRRIKPDVIHTHLKHADLVGAWASRRMSIPMISTLHLIESAPGPLGRVKRRLAAQARLTTAARTIAVSNAQRDWYANTFNTQDDRVICLHNGVSRPEVISDETARSIRSEIGIDEAAVVAAMVGIMRPNKGHEQLLNAIPHLTTSRDIQFVLLGDGSLRDDLEAQAVTLGLGPNKVLFAGFREDVAAVLQVSDLLVHPTLDDALPTALLHALAAGLPIVASDVGGIPEIVTPATGVLVPAGDIPALAKAIDGAVAKIPNSEAADAGRARFAAEFDADVWASRLRSLYEEVLSDR